jgi:lipopolysaccharide transport system ATP-binding protein
MSTIIKIENLSKKYIIGHQRRERYTALRDVIMQKLRGMGERLRHPLSPNKEKINLEEIWALKDVNMEIKQGDRLGIIGRNGAGKSTLLKVLSRITEPTTGRITLKGRVVCWRSARASTLN